MKTFRNHTRIFFEGAMLSYRALFRWLRPTVYFASKILAPLSMMIFFVFIGSYASGTQYPSFFVIGNALLFTAASGIFGVTMSIGGERWNGTLPYIFGSPANRIVVFFGRAFIHIFDGMLGAFIGLAWGILLFELNLSDTNFGIMVLTIFITSFSTASLGLLMGCLGLITRNVMLVNNTIYFLLILFSGANIQVESLPFWMQEVSMLLPLTRGVAAARIIIAGANFSEVLPILIEELFVGLIFLFLGFSLFRIFEMQAKKSGTLEVF